MLLVDFDSLPGAEIASFVILNMVVMTAWALDVEGLRDGRKSQKFVLLEVLSEKVCLVPIKTVLAVSALAPPAAVDHTTSIGRVLFTVYTLMLRAMEEHLPLRLCFELSVETLVVERTGTSGTKYNVATIPADLAML